MRTDANSPVFNRLAAFTESETDPKELKLPTKARSITANKPVEVTDTAERYMGEMNAEQTSIKEMEEEVKNYMTTSFEKTKGTIRSTIETSREEHIPVHSTSVEGEVGREVSQQTLDGLVSLA